MVNPSRSRLTSTSPLVFKIIVEFFCSKNLATLDVDDEPKKTPRKTPRKTKKNGKTFLTQEKPKSQNNNNNKKRNGKTQLWSSRESSSADVSISNGAQNARVLSLQ